MRNLNLLLLLVFLPLIAFGQPPGYLGKRASLNLTLSTTPVIAGPTKNDRGRRTLNPNAGSLGLNLEFEGNFNYVIGRYRSIGIIGGMYTTGHPFRVFNDGFTSALIPEGDGIFGERFNDYDLFFQLRVRSIGLILSRYKQIKGALAPIGNRFYWGIKRNFIKSEITDSNGAFNTNFNIDQTKAFNFLLLGWSNNQVFWDRVLFKTGLRIAMPLSLKYIRYASNGEDTHPNYFEDSNQVNHDVGIFRRILRHELFRLDISVGYLLF